MNTADGSDWAWAQDDTAPKYGDSVPATYVHWHDTNLCVDIICECGTRWHWDGFFAHLLRCTACGAVWALPTNLRLMRLSDELRAGLSDMIKDLVDS